MTCDSGVEWSENDSEVVYSNLVSRSERLACKLYCSESLQGPAVGHTHPHLRNEGYVKLNSLVLVAVRV